MGFSGGAVVTLSQADKFETFGTNDNIAAALNSTYTLANLGGYNTITFQLTVPTGGTVQFQSSFDDGVTYTRCTMRGTSSDSYTQITSTSGGFIGSIAGMTHFRVIVTSAGSAAGTITGRLTKDVSTLEGQEQPPPTDFIFNVSRGLIRSTTAEHKFGRNPDIDTAAEETVWGGGGIYTWSSGTNETWHAVSTSTADTTVRLHAVCLDTNYRSIAQTVVLNGQTAVPLSGALYRINRAYVTGSVEAAGSLYVFKSGGGVTSGVPNSAVDIRAFVDPSDQQTLGSYYTVASGTTAFIMDLHAEASTGNADLKLKTREINGVFRTRARVNVNAGASVNIDFNTYLNIPAKSDIKFDASVSANNTAVSTRYDMILVTSE
jgi:hypothetical protein